MSDFILEPLGSRVQLQGGYAFSSALFGPEGIPVVRISDISNSKIILKEAVCISECEMHKPFLIDRGDILIAMSGATTGKVGRFNDGGKAYLNQRVGRFLSKTSCIAPSFLFYLVTSEEFQRKLLVDAIGGAQPNISGGQIEKIIVRLPDSWEEQVKIARILTSIDEQIEVTAKLIEKNNALKYGLIDSLIIRDLDFGNSIPVKGNIEVLTGYPFNSQEFNGDALGYPLLRIRDLSSALTEIYYSGPVPDGFWVENGDVLIGMDGEFNLRVWRGERALLNQRVMRLRELPESKMSLRYLSHYLPIFLQEIENKTPQTTVKHLSHLSILNAKFKFPDRDRQDEIADIISSVDSVIDNEKLNLEKLELQKQGLMQDLLTGRVRVN